MDISILNVERSTVCYKEDHLAIVFASYLILVIFSIPLPVVSFVLMWRYENRLDTVLLLQLMLN